MCYDGLTCPSLMCAIPPLWRYGMGPVPPLWEAAEASRVGVESLLSRECCSDPGILRPTTEERTPVENWLHVPTSGALSEVGLGDLVHTLARHATLAYCGGAAFHRTGAHVACGEDAWAARLQRSRQTADTFPRGSVDDCVAGFYKALF